MPPKKKRGSDAIRVLHMVQAIEEALSFIKGVNRKDLESDRMLVLSLIKETEMIGEAAAKVSTEFQKKYSDVPWRTIVATRNRLIHGYFEVDLDILWETVTTDFPDLLSQLKDIPFS